MGNSSLISQVVGQIRRPDPYAKAPPYITKLTPEEESRFQNWVKSNGIPWQDVPSADYDMRGFWKAMQSGDPIAVRAASNGHFPDTWKTPMHKTFSSESIYALPGAPSWKGSKLVMPGGTTVADEGLPEVPKLKSKKSK